MQNNGTIPNVSTVFRELVKISLTNARLNSQNQVDQFRSSNNYSNGNSAYDLNRKSDNGWQSQFPSSIAENDRQQRHEALMGRLRNSVQENRQLLGIQESPVQRMSNYTYSNDRPQGQVSSFGSNNMYSHNQFNGFGNRMGEPRENGGKWAPPKIKYRHIEDLQQKSVEIQSNQQSRNITITNKRQSMQKGANLKQQFYQQGILNNSQQSQPNKQNYQRRTSNQATQQINTNNIQTDNPPEEDQQQQQNLNKLSIMSQKPSKYNQNLQSYYDICRKPIKPKGITGMGSRGDDKSSISDKFMRKQVPKVEGINLEKAMKILSIDD